MLTNFLLILASSLALAFALTPLFRRIALRTGSVDRPDERKIHLDAMPLLGGIGIYLAVIGAVLLFGDRFYVRQAAGILVGGSLVSFTGLWDDHRSLRPGTKLAVQLFAAVLVVATGIQVQLFRIEWINVAVTLGWFVVVSNAFNLVDNADGLSAGLAAIASAFFLILSAINGQYLVGMLSAAMLGASLGFLVYNFNPASIFMGDAGSLFVGFIIAAIGVKLRFEFNSAAVTWMVPVMVLAIPLFDTIFVVSSRIFRDRSVFAGAKDHVSHVLADRMSSRQAVVVRLYVIGTLAGMLAVLVSFLPAWPAYGILAVLIITGVGVACRLFSLQNAAESLSNSAQEVPRNEKEISSTSSTGKYSRQTGQESRSE